MSLDIAALQWLYEADYSANVGDTLYQWDAQGNSFINGRLTIDPISSVIFQTIWDGNGRDTYNLSNFGNGVSIDLRPGYWSIFSSGQLADLNALQPGQRFAPGNVCNALQWGGDPRSLIENAFGGVGNDSIVGNAVRNYLYGGEGTDYLYGLGGRDILLGNLRGDFLQGGGGADLLIGGPGADRFYFNSINDSLVSRQDVIRGFDGIGVVGGDVLDLSGIDADPSTAADDFFRPGTTGLRGFQLFDMADGSTQCALSIDADADWEFALTIYDGATLASSYTRDEFVF